MSILQSVFHVFSRMSLTAHEYKHYSGNGTGLRSLLDTYVFLQGCGKEIDWDYVEGELNKLGIADFERTARSLSEKLFEGKRLSGEETDMLSYILGSGTYGTLKNGVRKGIREKGRLGYVLGQVFPGVEFMKHSVDFVGKYPFLYPAGVVYRWGRILLCRRRYLGQVMQVLFRNEK